VKDFLERNIPGLRVGGVAARGTGAFEIEDVHTGYVYHSKNRQGTFPDNPYIMQNVGRAIKADYEERLAAARDQKQQTPRKD
jgi:hypothetical protein